MGGPSHSGAVPGSHRALRCRGIALQGNRDDTCDSDRNGHVAAPSRPHPAASGADKSARAGRPDLGGSAAEAGVTMQRRDARELLDSFIGEELLVETNHDLLRHLATCPECTDELEGRRRIRSGLKRAFGRSADLQLRPEFTQEVTARLQASVRPARWRWQTRWLPIAASLVLL